MALAGNKFTRLGPVSGARMVIAGGCGGIGRVLTRAAIELDIQVAVLDLEPSLSAFPPPAEAMSVPFDAMDDGSVHQAMSRVSDRFDAIDCLVNLVGFRNRLARFDEVPVLEWERVVAGNLLSAVSICRHALPGLLQSGAGSIVNVASSLGMSPVPDHAPYAAAKAALLMLTRSLAIEAAPGIRANAVAPSAVDTEFHRGGTGRPVLHDTANDPQVFARGVPLGRIAQPEDVVGPILFLAGPHSGFMTGQTLVVNGGKS